jgi:DNA polymerase-1
MPTLLAIDGNSLMHRAFHAIPLLNAADGSYTNAVYGFLNMLVRLIKEIGPSHAAVAFDMHGPTFRHESFAEYKAGRSKTPDELVGQFDVLKRVLSDMGIAVIEKQGYEADDILGALSKKAGEGQVQAVLVTGDRDAWQLVSDNTRVLYTKRGITDTETIDPQAVEDKLGVPPSLVADLKGLMGDSSDNIPGVPGVGPKTASRLINEFGPLEAVLENADRAGGKKLCESLVQYAVQARMSKQLSIIETAIDGLPTLEDLRFSARDTVRASETLKQLGMTSLVTRIGALAREAFDEANPDAALSPSFVTVIEEHATPEALAAAVEGKERVAIYADDDGISVSVDAKKSHRLAFAQTLLQTGYDEGKAFSGLSALFADAAREKILYDAKALRHRLGAYGVALLGPMQDVMLMAYVEDSSRGQHALIKQCEEHGIMAEERAEAAALLQLYDAIGKRLADDGTLKVYTDIELPLCEVLFLMERRGFSLDLPVLRALGTDYGQQIETLQQSVEEMAGHAFNLNSPKQVGTVLFEELGLPAVRKTKSGYSTDAAALEAVADAHPIVNKLLEYRKLAKLKSTYLDGLQNVADAQTGKVHTRFTQNVTATGRISSTEPNLQNIPVRTDVGREIRRAFIASAPDRVLVVADYSQIELRLLAHMAQEEHMIEVFLKGGDIHAATAARVFGLGADEVTKEYRTAAKAVNFGIIYGISDFGLARNLNIGRAEAGKIIADYRKTYPRIHSFMQSCIAFGREHGYVETLYKRRRYLPELASKNYAVRAFGERAAMNAPFQGTAADMIKAAMIRVERELGAAGLEAELILQVHDELIVDCRAQDAPQISGIVRDCMQNILTLSVPLSVEVGIGVNWLEAK